MRVEMSRIIGSLIASTGNCCTKKESCLLTLRVLKVRVILQTSAITIPVMSIWFLLLMRVRTLFLVGDEFDINVKLGFGVCKLEEESYYFHPKEPNRQHLDREED